MAEKILVLSEPDFSIYKYHGLPEAGLTFFENTRWGSAGMVYERKNSKDLIQLLKDPYLFAVQRGDEMVGTAVFCHTRPRVKDREYNAFIIRYFAAANSIQGKKVIKHYASRVMDVVRDAEQEKTIYVGCVEKGNARSFHVVSSVGYEVLGTLKVQAFSRLFPKAQKSLERIDSDPGRQEVLTLLRSSYRNHVLVHFDYLFLNNHYFVIRNPQHEIVAGCQYHRVHWAINRMPGVLGKLIMNVLPVTPIIRRLFNPKRFEFLALEGIYFKPGYESAFHQLMEGILHQEQLTSALFWMGDTCPNRIALEQYGKLGLLQKFIQDSGVYIMTSYRNMSPQEIEELKSGPLYASAFDYI